MAELTPQPVLDLKRDIGWFLYDIEEGTKDEVLSDLQSIIINPDQPETFASFEDFKSVYKDATDQCGTLACEAYYTTTLDRAAKFFQTITDVQEIKGDVAYTHEYQECGYWWAGCQTYSGLVFIDYTESAKALYDYLFSFPLEGEFEFVESHIVSMGEVAPEDVSEVKVIPFELSEEKWDEMVKFADAKGMDEEALMGTVDELFELELDMDQVLTALKYGYLEVIQGLSKDDQKRVLKLVFDSSFALEKGIIFTRYTMGAKYPIHRKFAEDLAQMYPDLTTDMIMSIVTSESKGNRMAVNDAGNRFGLMQLSKAVFSGVEATSDKPGVEGYLSKYHRNKKRSDISLPQLPEDIFHYQSNMAAGSDYLQWCLSKFNPDHSVGVALANYNWGPGLMRKYRNYQESPDTGFAGFESLPGETVHYIAKYLTYMGHFADMNS